MCIAALRGAWKGDVESESFLGLTLGRGFPCCFLLHLHFYQLVEQQCNWQCSYYSLISVTMLMWRKRQRSFQNAGVQYVQNAGVQDVQNVGLKTCSKWWWCSRCPRCPKCSYPRDDNEVLTWFSWFTCLEVHRECLLEMNDYFDWCHKYWLSKYHDNIL